MFAVVTRPPGGLWERRAGPFETPARALEVAREVLAATPRGEAIVGTCPWDARATDRRNIDNARTAGLLERIT